MKRRDLIGAVGAAAVGSLLAPSTSLAGPVGLAASKIVSVDVNAAPVVTDVAHHSEVERLAGEASHRAYMGEAGISAFQNCLDSADTDRLDEYGRAAYRGGFPIWSMSRRMVDHLASIHIPNPTKPLEFLPAYPEASRPFPYWYGHPVYVRDDEGGEGSHDPLLVAYVRCHKIYRRSRIAYTFSAAAIACDTNGLCDEWVRMSDGSFSRLVRGV